MPTWWGRKSSKNKEEQRPQQRPQPEPHGGLQFNFIKSPIRNVAKRGKDKPKSFDEVSAMMLSRSSPRASKDFTPIGAAGVGGSSSGLSCCDSGHPLPPPSVSSPQSFRNDHGDGDGSGSASISGSSVSSTGSYDDHPISQFDGIRLGFRKIPSHYYSHFGISSMIFLFLGRICSFYSSGEVNLNDSSFLERYLVGS